MSWRLVICGACALAGASCRSEAAKKVGGGMPAVLRGDVVVVERGAADFFQGRVLAVSGSKLKVQADDDGEPVTVARSDAYPLGPGARSARKGDALICGDGGSRWAPCLARGIEAGGVSVQLASGDGVVPFARVVVPGAVTALNVRRFFEKLEATRKFVGETRRAGMPRKPQGWLPEPREPVLARHGEGWYSAHSAGLDEDGGVRVVFRGGDRAETVASTLVVPVPPFTHPFAPGQFALIRGKTEGEAWTTVRIEALGPDEAMLAGPDGSRFRASVRELVPLFQDEPAP